MKRMVLIRLVTFVARNNNNLQPHQLTIVLQRSQHSTRSISRSSEQSKSTRKCSNSEKFTQTAKCYCTVRRSSREIAPVPFVRFVFPHKHTRTAIAHLLCRNSKSQIWIQTTACFGFVVPVDAHGCIGQRANVGVAANEMCVFHLLQFFLFRRKWERFGSVGLCECVKLCFAIFRARKICSICH